MIDEDIENLRATRSIPGLSIAVVQDGHPLLLKGYGWANVEPSVPATEEAIYEIGPVGKTFTATAAMMLVEQKKIDLDDSINDYLDNPPSKWQPVTLRHIILLCNLENINRLDAIALSIAEQFIPDLAQEALKPPL